MDIVIFKELATDDYLNELQVEADKYGGLYVEMDDPEQRKYVKDKAVLISSILKKLDRARIDKSREYKISIDEEAADIKGRLEAANLPFTLLIDGYNEKRKKILAEKKAIEDAAALIIQIEIDHNEALTINKVFDFERDQDVIRQAVRDENIRAEAAERVTRELELKAESIEKERLKVEKREQEVIDARRSNAEYRRSVNIEIVELLHLTGITRKQAQEIVTVIAKNQIPHLTINY